MSALPSVSLDGPAYEVSGLCKTYTLENHRIPVLTGVDLGIARGEWVSLVGPSGSGKTTLLHLLGALDRPTSGEIRCFGQEFGALSRRSRAVLRRTALGLVFQSYHLFPELNALENVMLPGLHWGRDRGAVRERAADLLTSFGLGHRLRHRPQELSGGEQQRVGLARALINQPAVILADEPTGNLDATAGKQITDLLRGLHDEGKTIVMVSHDLGLAAVADRVLRLQNGQAVETEI